MRVSFAIHGSRGDVQPALSVAAELSRRGHHVRFAVAEDLVDSVARTGIPTEALCPSTSELLASPLIKKDLKSANPRTRYRALREVGAYGVARSEQVMLDLADDSDALITGPLAQDRAATIAESRDIAFVPLHYCPIRPTGSVSPLYHSLPQPISKALWTVADRVMWCTTSGADRRLRDRLGLPPDSRALSCRLREREVREIQAYEHTLFPHIACEWGPQRPFVGFMLPDKDVRDAMNGADDMTDSAVAWAESGTPPVYVGFGSMRIHAERIAFIVSDLLARGLRVIAHTSHPLADHPALLQITGTVDHTVLLGRCRSAVHHGGAGTTAAALRSGIPSVVGWLSADQPIWAAALRRQGAGIGTRLSRLRPGDLDLVEDARAARDARELSRRIVGPATAVDAACDIITA